MTDQWIKGGEWPRRYFTMLPNMIDDSDLDPYERTLLVHYYRVGECWEGTRTTAGKCNMSAGAVVKKRRSLAEKGWIEIREGDGETLIITVIDRWEENVKLYTKKDSDGKGVHQVNGRSSGERGRSSGERGRSSGERKNNNTRITKEEEADPARDSQKNLTTLETEATFKRVSDMGNRKREEIKKWLNANRLPHPDDAEWDRLYHPAVITWMDVTGRWPTYAAMPHIIETMGDDPDRDALKRVWDLWRASDYNVANIAGILDRYARDVGDAGGGDGEAGDAWARVLEKIRNQKRGFTDRERVAIHEAGGAYNIRTANDFELDREFRPAFIEAWRQSATADDAPAPEEETEG